MLQRLLKKPLEVNKSFFLFGPRGTGKTSWLREISNSLYFDLLEAQWRTLFLANPQRLSEYIPPDYKGWVILDEVQKVPDLLNEVHRLIELKKYKFILSGSSARALRKKGVNLLAGRALIYHMYPLIYQELKEKFVLKHYLQYGGLPSIYYHEDNPSHYLLSYVSTYVYEEILEEGLARQLGAFARFLESASFCQGSALNMSAIGRDCGVSSKTVAEYFNILDDLMMGYQLPAFTQRAKRRIALHPKFYYFDVGIFRILRPKGPLDSVEEAEGPALETVFLQHLRAINEYYQLSYKLYYWRTAHGVEVDFILYGEQGLIALEIKRKQKLDTIDLRGLKEFLLDYPEAKAYIIYGGENKQYFDNIVALPFMEALQTLPTLLGAKEET
jgi:predicted AAA+ superfamily ATPase